jgi:hypothetical protein
MRTFIVSLLLAICVGFGAVAFGVNPIGLIPEAYIGYKIGPVVPALSVNFVHFKGSFEYVDEYYDEEYSGIGSISMMVPKLGAKILIGSSALQPFLRLSMGLPFILSTNLELDVDDPDVEDEIDDFIDDVMDGTRQTLILDCGAGVEYFLADQFSIGGEFKYGLLTAGGGWDIYDDESIDVKGTLGGTSTGLWLNYYF